MRRTNPRRRQGRSPLATAGGTVAYRELRGSESRRQSAAAKGDPGYSAKMDGDGDGVACER